MKVSNITSQTIKIYTLKIEDGEVRSQPYSPTGREYRVQTVTVKKREGNVSAVEIRGSVLKKDGTLGANGARETFYAQRDWPEWLRSIVEGLA